MSSKKDLLRDEIEQTIRVYLEAARYLAICGPYDEEKFDQVETILSHAPKGSMDSTRRAQIKESVQHILPQYGAGPWDQVKVMEHQSLAEAVGVFLKLLWELRPGEQTSKLVKWARDEMVNITNLIQKE